MSILMLQATATLAGLGAVATAFNRFVLKRICYVVSEQAMPSSNASARPVHAQLLALPSSLGLTLFCHAAQTLWPNCFDDAGQR